MRGIIVALLFGSFAVAAIPPRKNSKPKQLLSVDESVRNNYRKESKSLFPKQKLLALLKLPKKNRLKKINLQAKSYSKALRRIAFTKTYHIKLRWRAFTTLVRMQNRWVQLDLDRAFKHKDWFLRDAALRVSCLKFKKLCKDWSRKLIDDPALVVRTSAVKQMIKNKDLQSSDKLWIKLYSQENYRKGKSLWIRKYLAKAQATFSNRLQKDKYWPRFYKILKDKDKSLHSYAISGLEKIYSSKKMEESIYIKRKKWLSKLSRKLN